MAETLEQLKEKLQKAEAIQVKTLAVTILIHNLKLQIQNVKK